MKTKLTVHGLLKLKGVRQLTMTNAADYNTARAAEAAGLDIIAGRGIYDERQMRLVVGQLREAAPNTLIACNLPGTIAYVSDAEAIRCAMVARDHGADLIYSSGNSIERFRAMANLGIPCVGHVGLVPVQSTWIGGLRAFGKTVEEAVQVYHRTLEFQEAGAVAVEIECVPTSIAAEITRRMRLLTISIGSGAACDGQFLFASDILGTLEGRYPGHTRPYDGPLPRHAKRYANLFDAAVEAFQAFSTEVASGAFPGPKNSITISDDVLAGFEMTLASQNKS